VPGRGRGMGRDHLPGPGRGDAVRPRVGGHPHRAFPRPGWEGASEHGSGAGPVSTAQVRVFPGTYRDSLLLASATRAMQDGAGVSWAAAVMATPANVEDLTGRGISAADLQDADANALVLAVQAEDEPAAGAAVQRGHDALFAGESRTTAEPGQ